MISRLLLLTLVAASVSAQPPMTVRIGANVLRRNAIEAPAPEYPLQSFRAGREGTVVATMLVETDGSVSTVDVLEAPDALMGSSVEAKLKRWRFKPFTNSADEPIRATGRLVFYFVIRNGHPVVIDATRLSPPKPGTPSA